MISASSPSLDHKAIIGPGGAAHWSARELEHFASHRRAGGQRSVAAVGAGSPCLRWVGGYSGGQRNTLRGGVYLERTTYTSPSLKVVRRGGERER